jgi:hypothetical protein
MMAASFPTTTRGTRTPESMIYPDLLTAIYGHFDRLLNSTVNTAETDGAFVFLPEDYANADDFEQVRFEFWPVHRIRQFLRAGGQTVEGLMDLLDDLEPGEEFLAMIVEQEGETSLRTVHIHKITSLGLN